MAHSNSTGLSVKIQAATQLREDRAAEPLSAQKRTTQRAILPPSVVVFQVPLLQRKSTALNDFPFHHTRKIPAGTMNHAVRLATVESRCFGISLAQTATGRAAIASDYLASLKFCTSPKDLENVRLVHNLAAQTGGLQDVYLTNALIHGYAKCGSIGEACDVFNEMQHRNAVSWTSLVLGYAENGEAQSALEIFCSMTPEDGVRPDGRTIVAALKACINLTSDEERLHKGMAIHALSASFSYDSNVFVVSSLVNLYCKCSSLQLGHKMFDAYGPDDLVCLNSLMFGYVENGESGRVLELFLDMTCRGCRPSAKTIIAVLKACCVSAGPFKQQDHLAIHSLATAFGFDTNSFVASELVDMYSKSGRLTESRRVFEAMQHPDVVSWTALMFGHVDHGQARVVMQLFLCMLAEGCQPNDLTFLAVLKACGIIGALENGNAIHALVLHLGIEMVGNLANCLVDFYGRCGNMANASRVFDNLHVRDLATWNALITGYSRQGDTESVISVFERLTREAGLRPNAITFLSLLAACNHAGLVGIAREYFYSMSSKYGITPGQDHYQCMVDLLGRTKDMDTAVAFAKGMPYGLDEVTCTSLKDCAIRQEVP